MAKENTEILVLGSVVNDVVLLPKNKREEFFGGTGANIAYGLGMLGISATLFSVAGKDFNNKFAKHLSALGVDLKLYVDKKEISAQFLIDKRVKNNRKEIWEPNIYNKIEEISLLKFVNKTHLRSVKIAIFSPGTPKSIAKHLHEFRSVNQDAFVIFDPGQMTYFYSKKVFKECISLADMLILNEFEFEHVERAWKQDLKKLLKKKILIKTLGEKGSEIYLDNEATAVPVFKTKKFVDATGAGDAYRAGLIYGITEDFTLIEAATFGSELASKCVEHLGCQSYTFNVK